MKALLWLALAIAIVAPLAPLPAAAQAADTPAPATVNLLADNRDDVAANPAGQAPEPVPAGSASFLDLVGLTADETADDLVFHVAVATLAAPAEAPIATSGSYSVFFAVRDNAYRAGIFRNSGTGGAPQYFGSLSLRDPNTGRYTSLMSLPVTVDTGANTLSIAVPRQSVVDTRGAAPFPGMPINDFHVRAAAITDQLNLNFRLIPGVATNQGRPVTVFDAMPDHGNGTVPMPIAIGARQSGHATLASDDPVRASNGEATTFVYKVRVHNEAPKVDSFVISAKNVPGTWTVTVPGGAIDVGGDQEATFPVLLTVPFAHQHGTFQKFTVEAQSKTDAGTTGRIELGIRFNLIPQPAGHHPRVWFHGQHFDQDPVFDTACQHVTCGADAVYMNAIEDDPGITDPTKEPTVPAFVWDSGLCADTPVTFCGTSSPPAVATYKWFLDLQPGLQMGLDFDLANKGAISWPVGTTIPLQGASLSGVIYYYGPTTATNRNTDNNTNPFAPNSNETVVARIDPSAPQDIAAQGTAVLESVVTPLKGGDYIPYVKGASLMMVLNLSVNGVAFGGVNDGPFWAKGGTMDLPLVEYHDPVGEAFSIPVLSLTADGAVERAVNPGKTVLFNLTLANQDNQHDSFVLSLGGQQGSWGRLLGDSAVDLDGYQRSPVRVAITVPATAHVGERGDVLVKVTNANDPNEVALLQLHAVVDDKPQPDDGALVGKLDGESKHKSPALGPMVLVGIAALVLVVRRRKA